MRKIATSLLWLAWLVIILAINMAGLECNSLEGETPSQLVSYLTKTVPDRENTECIAFAITKLGSERFEPAAFVLTKFLDVPWPPNAHQKQRLYVIEHSGGSIYPAATALQEIGSASLPSILEAIRGGCSTRRSCEVAVSVWMRLHNYEPIGVALLKQEADRSTDRRAKQRLAWAAFEGVGWCTVSSTSQCKAALNTQYPGP